MGKALRLSAIVCGVLVLAACDTIPREALNAYVSAFDEARASGEALTTDFIAARAESDRRDATAAPPAPVAILLTYVPPAEAQQTATDVRLMAW